MTITSIQDKVTKTGAFQGSSVDISGITGDWTIVLEVFKVDASNVAWFSFEDSVDDFTTTLAGPTVSVPGLLTLSNAPKRYTFQKRDFPALRFGTPSASFRINLAQLTGSSPHVTFQAYLES